MHVKLFICNFPIILVLLPFLQPFMTRQQSKSRLCMTTLEPYVQGWLFTIDEANVQVCVQALVGSALVLLAGQAGQRKSRDTNPLKPQHLQICTSSAQPLMKASNLRALTCLCVICCVTM
jgi:hypothetical protein